MDITALFKASVKTVRLRQKSFPAPDQNRILKKSTRSEFTIKTKDICHQITQLKNLLIDNRAAYMRFGQHLKSSAQMTDQERDIIDQESEKILEICTHFINDLRLECKRLKAPAQPTEHMEGILELLSNYLRAVYNIYSQQKSYRIKHELDSYKLLKLESNKKLIPVLPVRERMRLSFVNGEDEKSEDDRLEDANSVNGKKRSNLENRLDSKNVAMDEDMASKFALEQDEVSAEDIQLFESENHQLYNDLKGLSDEVEQIEKNVVDIAKLQEIFTEKVE